MIEDCTDILLRIGELVCFSDYNVSYEPGDNLPLNSSISLLYIKLFSNSL